jgi:hypothetical protein
MATFTDRQIKEILTAVSDDYSNGGESGALSAPAEEVLQAVWVQLREIANEGN